VTLRIALSVAEILLFVAVLAFFLVRIRTYLGNVVANLEKIADGVGAVHGHCAAVGPGVEQVNALLAEAAGHLERAAEETESLGRP
jgi:hypothetical protein